MANSNMNADLEGGYYQKQNTMNVRNPFRRDL